MDPSSAALLKRLPPNADSEQDIPPVVDKLFELALQGRASDIHLEPQAAGLFVRFRMDGALHPVQGETLRSRRGTGIFQL